ncbi:MAG: STAS domain-containing protein [Candidatus Acidiferrales bacterium]
MNTEPETGAGPDAAGSPVADLRTLTLRTYAASDAFVVECRGPLIAETSAHLKTEVKAHLPHQRRIVLDLKDVHRMDSSGLGVLVGLYISARHGKVEFAIANVSRPVRDLLGLSNLIEIFELCGRHGIRMP